MVIYVSSLPFKLKESELREIFEKFGEVTSAKIIIDKITRQNKGFGFVEMPDEGEAINAIELLNGTELLGRTIIVARSEEKKEVRKQGNTNGGEKGKDNETISKGNTNWRKKIPRKKKDENVIGTYNDDKEGPNKRKNRKSPKNFKVGRRKKH